MYVDPDYNDVCKRNLRNITFDESEEFSDDRIKWCSVLSQRLRVSKKDEGATNKQTKNNIFSFFFSLLSLFAVLCLFVRIAIMLARHIWTSSASRGPLLCY